MEAANSIVQIRLRDWTRSIDIFSDQQYGSIYIASEMLLVISLWTLKNVLPCSCLLVLTTCCQCFPAPCLPYALTSLKYTCTFFSRIMWKFSLLRTMFDVGKLTKVQNLVAICRQNWKNPKFLTYTTVGNGGRCGYFQLTGWQAKQVIPTHFLHQVIVVHLDCK